MGSEEGGSASHSSTVAGVRDSVCEICDSPMWDSGTQRGQEVEEFENRDKEQWVGLGEVHGQGLNRPWVRLLQLLAGWYQEHLRESKICLAF